MYSLKEGQIDRLLKLTNNKKHRLILLLMLDCGLGVSRCASLRISSFDFGKRILNLGNKVVSISDRCYDLLSEYISGINHPRMALLQKQHSHKVMKNNQSNFYSKVLHTKNSFLFPSKNGHMCRKSINKFLERLAKKHPEFCGIHPKVIQDQFVSNSSTASKSSLFLDKLKGFFFTKKRKQVINLDSEISKIGLKTFGRKNEIEKIGRLLEKKVNIMILGGTGVGKSHLINCLVSNYKEKVLKLDDCYEIKRSLVNILMFLYKEDKDALKNELYPEFDYDALFNHLQKDSMTNLCKEIIKATSKNEYLLVIDSCDRITPRGVKILEELKDHFCILTSAREVPLNKSSFLWNFEMIRLKNLERRFAIGLICHLSNGMQIEDSWLFRNHVFEQSVGNPRVICELIDRYRKEVVVTCDVVREIRHSGSLKEYDCSWFVIIFLGVISCMRFMSHELGNDSLRFIGGCSVLGLLVFRSLFSKRRRL